jgi:hypothetical protein
MWNTRDNISKCVNDHLQQKTIGWKQLCGVLNFSYLSSSAVVVCIEGSYDVLSTPCSSGKWVGTWSLIHGGCYHVTEVGGPYGLWDSCWRLSFKITWTLWNYWRYNKYLFILVEIYQPVTSCRDWYEFCRPVLMIMFVMFVEEPFLNSGFAVYKLGHCHHVFLSAVTVLVSLFTCIVCWIRIICLPLGLATPQFGQWMVNFISLVVQCCYVGSL